MITIKTSFGGLEQYINRLNRINTDALSRLASDVITSSIRDTTAQHLDVAGRPFKPYTPGYKKKRKKMGLSIIPDLRVTGTLLNSLVAEKKGIITTVSAKDPNQGKVQGVNNLRPFIGISPTTKQKLINAIRQFVGLTLTQ